MGRSNRLCAVLLYTLSVIRRTIVNSREYGSGHVRLKPPRLCPRVVPAQALLSVPDCSAYVVRYRGAFIVGIVLGGRPFMSSRRDRRVQGVQGVVGASCPIEATRGLLRKETIPTSPLTYVSSVNN